MLEHQSKPDKLMLLRLWEYRLKIWRQHLKQPIAIISQVTGLRPVELEKLQKIAKEKAA